MSEVVDEMGEADIVQRLDLAEDRLMALERDRWDRAEFETRKHDFIREAATQLFALALTHKSFQPQDAWILARALWDSKPEDC